MEEISFYIKNKNKINTCYVMQVRRLIFCEIDLVFSNYTATDNNTDDY